MPGRVVVCDECAYRRPDGGAGSDLHLVRVERRDRQTEGLRPQRMGEPWMSARSRGQFARLCAHVGYAASSLEIAQPPSFRSVDELKVEGGLSAL
jgi:hypothetical protein